MRTHRAPPRRAWLVYRAGFGFSLYMGVTTFTLQLIDRLGAGQLTLALIGTVLEITYTLSEVPTGVLADRYGRKRSVVIGLFILAIGFNLTAFPILAVVIGAQVLWGIGWTCVSGADVAWITDEVGEDAARPLYAAGTRAELLASVAGIAAGATLGLLNLWLPLVVGGLGFALVGAWLVVRMAETAPARTHEDRLTIAETVRRTRANVRVRPAIAVALAVMVAAGLAGEGVDRLWQFHLVAEDAGAQGTVLIVAVLFAAGLLLGAAAAAFVGRRLEDPDPRLPARLLSWANYGVAASVVLLAVAPLPIAAIGFVACQALRHACEPLIYAWVNRGADSSVRATLNSLVGQSESVGEISGGPILGGIAATGGTSAALSVSAAVFATAGVVARWRRTLEGEEPIAREVGTGA